MAQVLLAVVCASFASAIYGSSHLLGWLGYVLALWAVVSTVRELARFARTSFWITNYRVVIQKGWGSTQQVSIPLGVIEGIDVRQTLGRVTQTAHVQVHSQGVVYVLRYIPRGQEFSWCVRQAQNQILESLARSRPYYG
ncbi:MAG: PH domain-containing protein [Rothia sp. (in: high G+C Gram-positive bacteria)]|nr:PH domain-containing protein [Rothia sp. (in: high G+C Gram-positive bacteria)]